MFAWDVYFVLCRSKKIVACQVIWNAYWLNQAVNLQHCNFIQGSPRCTLSLVIYYIIVSVLVDITDLRMWNKRNENDANNLSPCILKKDRGRKGSRRNVPGVVLCRDLSYMTTCWATFISDHVEIISRFYNTTANDHLQFTKKEHIKDTMANFGYLARCLLLIKISHR